MPGQLVFTAPAEGLHFCLYLLAAVYAAGS